jgi:hypothetical protein
MAFIAIQLFIYPQVRGKKPCRSRTMDSPAMARIPETEIERLKNEVAADRLIEASGLELKRYAND